MEQGNGGHGEGVQGEGLDSGTIVKAVESAVGTRPVLLCGSRATGDAGGESDVDLAVVMPTYAVPFAARPLAHAQEQLERDLGASVSLNPLPRRLLKRPKSNLFVWKLLREARVLSAPDRFRMPEPIRPSVDDEAAFSYLLSAAFYLLEARVPEDLAGERLPPAAARGAEKALLHVAQLRLMRRGGYASQLDEALSSVGDPELNALVGHLATPGGWLEVRDLVLSELPAQPPSLGVTRGAARNVQYTILSALRGRRRWWAFGRVLSVDRRLATAAIELLSAVEPGGELDRDGVAAAAEALPPRLRPSEAGWDEVRSVCVREWASAHPLTGA